MGCPQNIVMSHNLRESSKSNFVKGTNTIKRSSSEQQQDDKIESRLRSSSTSSATRSGGSGAVQAVVETASAEVKETTAAATGNTRGSSSPLQSTQTPTATSQYVQARADNNRLLDNRYTGEGQDALNQGGLTGAEVDTRKKKFGLLGSLNQLGKGSAKASQFVQDHPKIAKEIQKEVLITGGLVIAAGAAALTPIPADEVVAGVAVVSRVKKVVRIARAVNPLSVVAIGSVGATAGQVAIVATSNKADIKLREEYYDEITAARQTATNQAYKNTEFFSSPSSFIQGTTGLLIDTDQMKFDSAARDSFVDSGIKDPVLREQLVLLATSDAKKRAAATTVGKVGSELRADSVVRNLYKGAGRGVDRLSTVGYTAAAGSAEGAGQEFVQIRETGGDPLSTNSTQQIAIAGATGAATAGLFSSVQQSAKGLKRKAVEGLGYAAELTELGGEILEGVINKGKKYVRTRLPTRTTTFSSSQTSTQTPSSTYTIGTSQSTASEFTTVGDRIGTTPSLQSTQTSTLTEAPAPKAPPRVRTLDFSRSGSRRGSRNEERGGTNKPAKPLPVVPTSTNPLVSTESVTNTTTSTLNEAVTFTDTITSTNTQTKTNTNTQTNPITSTFTVKTPVFAPLTLGGFSRKAGSSKAKRKKTTRFVASATAIFRNQHGKSNKASSLSGLGARLLKPVKKKKKKGKRRL